MSKNDVTKNDISKKNSKVVVVFFVILGIFSAVINIGKLEYFSDKKPDVDKIAGITDGETGKMKKFSDIDLNGFNARTITGETLTSDYFKENDITMINIWATYCGGCVTEMPGISKLYSERPKNSNIISICEDSEKENQLATEIMTDAGAEFLTLIPDEKLTNVLLSHVSTLPTTIFVDKAGKMVGEPIFGARTPGEYKEIITDMMELAKNV
ncbi:TlpA family protein disulfide reductase [Clostridium cellulovorans]|uniref:Alkyl hydroperoxide reductase/ Thiol specific antioxidant/ Mal allergen n=1 Tax=Clostridium cellulovorans (strain ATCC 35296 / DSM 3052 / OCM 3 / 743B) TaxID=573061 RepID=D9SV69_CLOC7|nr:TlpA disulfide reductase family protein [Clostridium cellulovorans]ADL53043.1 alkyl hydroperoxide reductase/ Thiol specific antioxidant/ Mal allergen [Clostridium cellulovorans 743B]